MIAKVQRKEGYPGYSLRLWLVHMGICSSGLIIGPIDGITDGQCISVKTWRVGWFDDSWRTFYN